MYSWHRWIAPYWDRTSGPFAMMYRDCVAGMAAVEQLDNTAAESCCRTALNLALQTGQQSRVTQPASALLGELLYERGQFIGAEELLAMGLDSEEGAAESRWHTYGTGARLAAVRGNLDGAQRHLTAGA